MTGHRTTPSSLRIEQSWCPTCKEWTVIDAGRPCAWCDTPTIRKRGGWKHPSNRSRISRDKALAIHKKYQTGVSARTLGRELHTVLGYKSAQSCEAAIGAAFKKHGLPTRDRIAATILAATKDGLSPRDHKERSRVRREAGLTYQGMRSRRPRCAGVRTQHPRAGGQCENVSMVGSDYCFNHDPARKEQRDRIAADMRARQTREQPTVQWADVHAQLSPWLDTERHPARALNVATGVPHGTCSRLLLGRHQTITPTLAARLLEPLQLRAAA